MQGNLKDFGLFDPLEDKERLTLSERIRDYNYRQTIEDANTDVQREHIRSYIYEHEPVTDIEICVALHISRTSVTARRNELSEIDAVAATQINGTFNTMWGRKQL